MGTFIVLLGQSQSFLASEVEWDKCHCTKGLAGCGDSMSESFAP